MIVIFTLWPSPRNFDTWRVLVSKSPEPILGRYFISLMAVLRKDERQALGSTPASGSIATWTPITSRGGGPVGATSPSSLVRFGAYRTPREHPVDTRWRTPGGPPQRAGPAAAARAAPASS